MVQRDEKGHVKEGSVLNPKGRPKREVERDYLDLLRSSVTPEHAKKIIDKAVTDAERGDSVARKWIFDYLIGPPIQKIAPTTPNGDNPYMGAELGDLIELANKIASPKQ
jgi:hypothetical protein